MSHLARWTLAALVAALLALPLGCGGADDSAPDDAVQDESGIPADEWNRIEGDININAEEGKADAPRGVREVGDIAPNTTARDEVTATSRFLGYGFRAEEATPVAAAATLAAAPSSGTVMVLYRRTSCLDNWQVVARGAAAMNPNLPGPGEYMLVSGARRAGITGPLETTFNVDQFNKIVTASNPRPDKLGTTSWLPTNALQTLKRAGLASFTDIARKGIANVARSSGLPEAAVRELSRLAPWLDVQGVTYPQACALQRAGVRDVEAYYNLSYEAQRRLEPAVPIATLPSLCNPTRNPGCRSVDPDLPPDAPPHPGGSGVRPGHRSPTINWTCYRSDCGWCDDPEHPETCNQREGRNRINNRPWTTTRHVTNEHVRNPANLDRRWYPDPAQGWDFLTYNFGNRSGTANSGPAGYILAQNRYTGLMRLFVWVPNGLSAGYGELVATVSVVDKNNNDVGWVFPTEPLPGTDTRRHGRRLSLIWKHNDQPGHTFELLTPGQWVRAEFQVLHEPAIYADANLRPVSVNIGLTAAAWGTSVARGHFKLQAEGMGVSTNSGSALHLLKNMALGALGFGSGAHGIWHDPFATGGASSSGLLLNAFAPDQAEAFRINLAGTVDGQMQGTVRIETPIFNPAMLVAGASGSLDEVPGSLAQLSRHVKIGTLRFDQSPSTRSAPSVAVAGTPSYGIANDPRPGSIPYVVHRCREPNGSASSFVEIGVTHSNGCQAGPLRSTNIGSVPVTTMPRARVDVGWLRSMFPWAVVTEQRVDLEIQYYDAARAAQIAGGLAPPCPGAAPGSPATAATSVYCDGANVTLARMAEQVGSSTIVLQPIKLRSDALGEFLDPRACSISRNPAANPETADPRSPLARTCFAQAMGDDRLEERCWDEHGGECKAPDGSWKCRYLDGPQTGELIGTCQPEPLSYTKPRFRVFLRWHATLRMGSERIRWSYPLDVTDRLSFVEGCWFGSGYTYSCPSPAWNP